jgi:hypothetical protein
MVWKYTLPIGLREYPIEVEIRFPRDLNESVIEEIKRLFLPFTYAMGRTSPQEPEEEIEEDNDFTKVDAKRESVRRPPKRGKKRTPGQT